MSKLRNGFTTGSCAAAASKAAAYMLFGVKCEYVTISIPAGGQYRADICDMTFFGNCARCAVEKDGGDDPDVTTGARIYATLSLDNDGRGQVKITGGEGVGIVTKPGLSVPVGEYAINPVPRAMIEKEVKAVMEQFDFTGDVNVEISVPAGREIAGQTFNPRLGIEGGISIIGTSGLVVPMSTKAIIDTIRLELNQKHEGGEKIAVVSPGNYGFDFLKSSYGFDLDKAVKCSNFIGETIDIARETGFERLLLVGHIGKLVKISGGIMNTHSREADCRMELMAAAAIRSGADESILNKILDSVSCEEAYDYMIEAKIQNKCAEYIMERIMFYLRKRAVSMDVECMVYSNKHGLIAASPASEKIISCKQNSRK